MHNSPSDDIDLLDIFRTLWRGRWLIIAVTFGFVLAGIAYAFLATPVYRSEVVLIPNESERPSNLAASLGGLASLAGINLGSSVDKMEGIATLRSRVLIEDFIRDEDLLPVLFADDWDAEKKRWKDSDEEDWPTVLTGVDYFIDEVRTVDENSTTGLVTLGVEWTDPVLAEKWTSELVQRVNDRLRQQTLSNSRQRLSYLNSELSKANLIELRQAISNLIEGEIQTITLAQADSEYAFKIVDPPRVPIEPVWPKKILIAAAAVFLGFVIGVLAVLLRAAGRYRVQ